MSGSMRLSDEEKQELIEDAKDARRGKAFISARLKSHEGSIDDYIEFLSANMDIAELLPTLRITEKFKL